MPFGAEFRCDRCGVISVLIIDRALVPLSTLQKQGEKVCIACGRTALREARSCQEGHPLVRECTECHKEFAVDHQRCDFCGRRTDDPFDPWLEVKQLMLAGNMTGAMYAVRQKTQLDLVEAKELVKSWADASPVKPNVG
jgi:predicted amidophosphoribosyltransferase